MSEAAVSDTAVSEATTPDAGGSDGGFDDSDVSVSHLITLFAPIHAVLAFT